MPVSLPSFHGLATITRGLLPLLEQEAKERQLRGKTFRKNLRKVASENGEAREIAARMTNTNAAYVQSVKRVQAKAPELVGMIRLGVLRVPDAARLARLPKKERQGVLQLCDGRPMTAGGLRDIARQVKTEVRQRAAKAFARSSRSTSSSNIFVGDMAVLHNRLNDDSVDLFLTDPRLRILRHGASLRQLILRKSE